MHHLYVPFSCAFRSMTPSKGVKTPKSGHPKFRNLRKRLQYKRTKDGTPTIEEQVRPLEDQPPTVEVEAPSNEEEDLSDNNEKRSKKQKYFNRASPMKLVRLQKFMNPSHHRVISDNGFGSFLRIKCSKLHPELCNFLVHSFNYKSCELEFPGRGSIPITEELVQKVLGCPRGEFPVIYQKDTQAVQFVMEALGFGCGKQPTLTQIETKLKGMGNGDEVYLMLWVLYVQCSILAPTTAIRVSPRCYPAIMDPSKIKDLNWARFVIMILIESTKENSIFNVCLAFLMLAYVNSLETDDITVENDVPSICAWDNKMIARAVEQDTMDDGSFGKLPKCFRKNKVLMLSTPAKIEKFVKANVPPNCSEEELKRYNEAAREMYSDIDFAVATFIRKVSTNNKQTEQPRAQPAAKSTRSSSVRMDQEDKPAEQVMPDVKPTDSDADYIYSDGGHHSDDEDTSLDEESFVCKEEKDSSDDFMSAFKKKKIHHPQPCAKRPILKKPILKKNKPAKDDVRHENVIITDAMPINARVPEDTAAQKQYTVVGANKRTVGIPTKKRKIDERVKGKSDAVPTKKSRNVVPVKKNKPVTVPENVCQVQVSATQLGTISMQRNNAMDLKDESKKDVHEPPELKVVHDPLKVVHDPLYQKADYDALENLKMYESGSQSSNDVAMVDIPSGPPTGYSRTKPKVCMKHDEDGTSVQAIRDMSGACANNTISDARNMRKKIAVPSAAVEVTVPLPKKSVSWADHSPSNPHAHMNQHGAQPVLPPKHSDNTQVNGNIAEPNGAQLVLPLNKVHKEFVPTQTPGTIARRPITRSISPLKGNSNARATSSPVTRSRASSSPVSCQKEIISPNRKSHRPLTASVIGQHKNPAKFEDVTPTTSEALKMEDSIIQDSINKKLIFESSVHQERKLKYIACDAPPFDLGLDDEQPEQESRFIIEPETGLPMITSSNEEQFYGPAEDWEKLELQMGENFFASDAGTSRYIDPQAEQTSKSLTRAEKTPIIVDLDAEVTDSQTPVPLAHKKRLLRAGRAQQSPFVQYDKKNTVTVQKDAVDVYNAVCQHGAKAKTKLRNTIIIDYGSIFIFTPDLADSVAPEGWLSNSTCELALHVLAQEMAPQKKCIMSLNISNKLRDHAFNGKDIKKAFKFSDTNRLDHKEQVMFPVLQNLSNVKDVFCGHYYLVNLNLKAERFEVMDSLRKDTDKLFQADSANIIAAVKSVWATHYGQSNIKIQEYETSYIPCPKQMTGFDCGYCMLKNMEGWDGRRMEPPFDPKDMPNLRILYNKKWLDWVQNKILWRKILFNH